MTRPRTASTASGPRSLKLFWERELGGATFVTARLARERLLWERTESYVSSD